MHITSENKFSLVKDTADAVFIPFVILALFALVYFIIFKGIKDPTASYSLSVMLLICPLGLFCVYIRDLIRFLGDKKACKA